jgi:hypothetical protein
MDKNLTHLEEGNDETDDRITRESATEDLVEASLLQKRLDNKGERAGGCLPDVTQVSRDDSRGPQAVCLVDGDVDREAAVVGDKLDNGHFGTGDYDDAVSDLAAGDGVGDQLECADDLVWLDRMSDDDEVDVSVDERELLCVTWRILKSQTDPPGR